jgi:EAL domain-containing protein (putative c-di-GMP-specific phosphodiesterase class I)
MKLKVIAEGVETDKQLGFLRQFGCTLIQGFILSKPKPLSELLSYRL